MKKNINKIFLLSQARSGSTMLQRILSTHSKITSIAEPWLLLPFLYANKKKSISEYSHNTAFYGIRNLIKKLPNGQDDYNYYMKIFFNNIYDLLSDDTSIYFLDKTPYYSKIIPEISNMYPDAKFIFLFRNPAQVYGSMLSFKGKPRFNMLKHAQFYKDLINGPKLLTEGYEKLKEKSFKINYEIFVQDPNKYLTKLCEYLNLEFEEEMLANFHQSTLEGWNGDFNGLRKYSNIVSTDPLDKWKQVFNTRYRRKVLHNFIESIDKHVLDIMGYEKKSLQDEIKLMKTEGKYSFLQDFYEYNKVKFFFRYNRLSFD